MELLQRNQPVLELLDLSIDKMMDVKSSLKTELKVDNIFLIIEKQSSNKLLSCLCCLQCGRAGIKFDTVKGNDVGFCSKASIYCDTSKEVISENYLSERIGDNTSSKRPFEVNTRAVFAFMGIGYGLSAMKEWLTMMNMPNCLNKTSYHGIKSKLATRSQETCSDICKKSFEIIRQKYLELGALPDKDGIIYIAVSFDGTWQKCCRSSHNGVGAVIDLLTGLPIDCEVLSNFCSHCLKSPEDMTQNSQNGKRNTNKNAQRIMMVQQTQWSMNV